MTAIPQDDAFAGGVKRESLSFKGAPVGTSYKGKIVEGAKLIQARDYDTGKPDFWDNAGNGKTVSDRDANGKPNNPVMTAVFAVEVNGEEKSVFAQKPSALFSTVAEAQRNLGRPMQPGDGFEITFVREEINPDPVKAKKQAPKKIYEVKLTAAPDDAFGGDEPDL